MSKKLELFDKDGKSLSVDDVMDMLPPITLLDKVKRVEIIELGERRYVNWKPNNKTEISLQDNGKTLKVFITNEFKYQ